MSEFPEEKTGNGLGSERDHDRKKQKVGVADEEGLSSLNEEERALILQMRQAKKKIRVKKGKKVLIVAMMKGINRRVNG